jgi:hypothetical protein
VTRTDWDQAGNAGTQRDHSDLSRNAQVSGSNPLSGSNVAELLISYYDIKVVEIYDSARKHGVSDADIEHAISHAVVVAEDEEGKVLYLGPDRAGNLRELVAVQREGEEELVIHAMTMRHMYEGLLTETGDEDDA